MKAPDYLTEQELEDLLKTALTGRYGVRDALLISLGYHHCLRVSELLELNSRMSRMAGFASSARMDR